MSENQLNLENHILLCIEVNDLKDDHDLNEYLYLKANFCGRVLTFQTHKLVDLDLSMQQTRYGIVYACGNIEALRQWRDIDLYRVKVIKEFSYNLKGRDGLDCVTLGEVPINLHGVGVYYRNPLGSHPDKNYFDILQSRHKFQSLTESNKPGTAFRKGVYLSEVQTDGDASHFHLLRCSTNLSGPTLAFADEDREILTLVNDLAKSNFQQRTVLNHVLAQVYENTVTVDDFNKIKENKAKIKSRTLNQTKKFTNPIPVSDFRVTLYPNSILLIPLSTNRLYTHEIVPPTLPVGRFPTRLGYVVRCSKTRAMHKDDTTFIIRESTREGKEEEVKLEKSTAEGVHGLKKLYQQENATVDRIEYPEFLFSLNEGDYKRPLVE
ncbi:hypothetical protein AA313_de0209290 [Arthrobotrys entomopaga]|nr:hypothetical protein AA313_de0209290 [Arthrobotrys entomopaga]